MGIYPFYPSLLHMNVYDICKSNPYKHINSLKLILKYSIKFDIFKPTLDKSKQVLNWVTFLGNEKKAFFNDLLIVT